MENLASTRQVQSWHDISQVDLTRSDTGRVFPPWPNVGVIVWCSDVCVCVQDAEGDEQTRDKRKFEGVTQAKFGIKNAVLGFVFGVSILF